MHATHLSRHTNSEKMQAILQWVGVGSVILMGAGAAVHLFRDLTKPHHECKPEPFSRHKYRELRDQMGEDRGR
ncbi:hypothetical protein R5W23_003727 [Gemmata sp. JC673]|uniref:Uncharacterized protein n=1 Tax=Gemmata algarum TaxID=2975278 RepID=A0ABU5F4L0_9BACT|nr:hypothetical protein [Gemmata algarum]MDY3562265.1 hypothetical protein [Gemmata algarum]